MAKYADGQQLRDLKMSAYGEDAVRMMRPSLSSAAVEAARRTSQDSRRTSERDSSTYYEPSDVRSDMRPQPSHAMRRSFGAPDDGILSDRRMTPRGSSAFDGRSDDRAEQRRMSNSRRDQEIFRPAEDFDVEADRRTSMNSLHGRENSQPARRSFTPADNERRMSGERDYDTFSGRESRANSVTRKSFQDSDEHRGAYQGRLWRDLDDEKIETPRRSSTPYANDRRSSKGYDYTLDNDRFSNNGLHDMEIAQQPRQSSTPRRDLDNDLYIQNKPLMKSAMEERRHSRDHDYDAPRRDSRANSERSFGADDQDFSSRRDSAERGQGTRRVKRDSLELRRASSNSSRSQANAVNTLASESAEDTETCSGSGAEWNKLSKVQRHEVKVRTRSTSRSGRESLVEASTAVRRGSQAQSKPQHEEEVVFVDVDLTDAAQLECISWKFTEAGASVQDLDLKAMPESWKIQKGDLLISLRGQDVLGASQSEIEMAWMDAQKEPGASRWLRLIFSPPLQ